MDFEPDLPIPISLIEDKLFLFDIDVITWLRRTHHICGVMGGTLPQNPSQNVFLGLPVQIMPEEAQLLIEKGVGYLVDDSQAHSQAIRSANSARHADYMAHVRRKAEQAQKIRNAQKQEERRQALSKQTSKKQRGGTAKGNVASSTQTTVDNFVESPQVISVSANLEADPIPFNAARLPLFSSIDTSAEETASSTSLFDNETPPTPQTQHPTSSTKADASHLNPTSEVAYIPYITPTTSADLLIPSSPRLPQQSSSSSLSPSTTVETPTTFSPSNPHFSFSSLTSFSTPPSSNATSPNLGLQKVPNLPSSYPLYRHLNSKSYFTTPGLRFGCQYSVYPGDPLRYHSHFLAVGYKWDEEIDLMDVVSGGRLGTGVKKGWLIGGEEEEKEEEEEEKRKNHSSEINDDDAIGKQTKIRMFSIEWAAM